MRIISNLDVVCIIVYTFVATAKHNIWLCFMFTIRFASPKQNAQCTRYTKRI